MRRTSVIKTVCTAARGQEQQQSENTFHTYIMAWTQKKKKKRSPWKKVKHLSTLPGDPIIKSVTAVSPMASSQSSGSCNQYTVVGVNPSTSRFLVLPWNEQGRHHSLMKYGTPPFPRNLPSFTSQHPPPPPPYALPHPLSCLCPVALVRKWDSP